MCNRKVTKNMTLIVLFFYSTHVCAKALNKEIITASATPQLLSLNKAAEHQCLCLIIDWSTVSNLQHNGDPQNYIKLTDLSCAITH